MARRGKSLAALDGTRPSPGDITIVRQQEPLGLGHAVWCARRLAGDEPFAVLLPDDLMVGEPGCLKQMVEAYHDLGGNLICTEEVAADQTHKRSEEHTSELQSLMRISYAVFCLKKKKTNKTSTTEEEYRLHVQTRKYHETN